MHIKELLKLIRKVSFLGTNKAYFLFYLLLNIGIDTETE